MIKVTPESRHFTASAIVVDLDTRRFLLVEHKAAGCWVFPGGHVDENEAPHQAAIREVREETGISITLVDPHMTPVPGAISLPVPVRVAEFDAPEKKARPGKPAEPAHHHIDFLYYATGSERSRMKTAADEVGGAKWVSVSDMAHLNVRAEVSAQAIEALLFVRRIYGR